jgi:hypothetical protein
MTEQEKANWQSIVRTAKSLCADADDDTLCQHQAIVAVDNELTRLKATQQRILASEQLPPEGLMTHKSVRVIFWNGREERPAFGNYDYQERLWWDEGRCAWAGRVVCWMPSPFDPLPSLPKPGGADAVD